MFAVIALKARKAAEGAFAMLDVPHSMEHITTPARALVDKEYKHAAAAYGPTFASHHEGYGVLAEEVLEAETDIRILERDLRCVLTAIRKGEPQELSGHLKRMYRVAINGAAECIQVAAMCKKFVATVMQEEKNAEGTD